MINERVALMRPRASRVALARVIGAVVDIAGGVPVTLPEGTTTRLSFRSRHLSRHSEAPVTRAFLSALGPDGVVVDIGAHWGLYTLLAAPRVAHVVALEPSHANLTVLRRNVQLSHARNVDILPKAVADVAGNVVFHQYAGASWGLSMMGGLKPGDGTLPVDVLATTVDSLALRPTVLKIDIEGAEGLALRGARRTLSEHRPVLIAEVHLDRLAAFGDSVDGLHSILKQAGYERRVLLATSLSGQRIEHWECLPH